MIVDAYCHCGLSRYRPIADVDAAMDGGGVERAVLVQHLGEFDNGYLAAIVRDRPDRFVAVGLIDERAADRQQGLEALARGGLAGVRLTEVALSTAFDLCVHAAKLGLVLLLDLPSGVGSMRAEVERLAARANGRPLVISHLGYPALAGDRLQRGREILALADVPEVHVLVSGFGQFGGFPHAPLVALTGEVVERFGAERLMWGSNFPESVDASTYRSELDLLTDSDAFGAPGFAAALAGATASRVWFDR